MKAILAVDSHWGIGVDGKLPWHFHMDMIHFNAYTRNKICLMGKTTYESIPEKNYTRLPTRHKVIMSHSTTRMGFDRCQHWAKTWRDAGCIIEEYSKTPDRSDVILIGGKSMYDRLLPYCEEIMLTRIDNFYGCDAKLDDYVIDKLFGDDDKWPGLFKKVEHIASIEEFPNGSLLPTQYHIERYKRINTLEPDKVPDDIRPVILPRVKGLNWN